MVFLGVVARSGYPKFHARSCMLLPLGPPSQQFCGDSSIRRNSGSSKGTSASNSSRSSRVGQDEGMNLAEFQAAALEQLGGQIVGLMVYLTVCHKCPLACNQGAGKRQEAAVVGLKASEEVASGGEARSKAEGDGGEGQQPKKVRSCCNGAEPCRGSSTGALY